MKIKLDENIPARLVNILSQFGHEIDTVPQEGLIGYNDNRVWEAAQNSKSFLITQDLDFSNTEWFKQGLRFVLNSDILNSEKNVEVRSANGKIHHGRN